MALTTSKVEVVNSNRTGDCINDEFSKFNFCYIFIATYYESCMVRFPHILMIDHHHGPYRNVWIFELHVGEQEISFAIKS